MHEASEEEIKYLKDDRCVYKYASWQEALQRSGKQPLRLKWIDANTGGKFHPLCRSRLVCIEVWQKGIESICSATLPLETLRVLVAKATSEGPHNRPDPFKLLLAEVSRAHFYAAATREVFIELPPENPGLTTGEFVAAPYHVWYP